MVIRAFLLSFLILLHGCATQTKVSIDDFHISDNTPNFQANDAYCLGFGKEAVERFGTLKFAAQTVDQSAREKVFVDSRTAECVGRLNAAARNFDTAYYWLRLSADRGNTSSLVNVAATSTQMTTKPNDFQDLLLKAAQTGDPEAIHNYAGSYLTGKPSLKDKATAIALYSESFRRGYSISGLLISHIYYNEPGFKDNQALGKEWLLRAVGQGDIRAKLAMAEHYYSGTGGFVQETSTAFQLAHEVSDVSPHFANIVLASWYIFGEHSEKNFHEAYVYIKEAAEHGDEKANAFLNDIDCFSIDGSSSPSEVCAFFPMFEQHYYQLIVNNSPLFTLNADEVESVDITAAQGQLTGGCKSVLKDYGDQKTYPYKVEVARDCQFYIDGSPIGSPLYWEWES